MEAENDQLNAELGKTQMTLENYQNIFGKEMNLVAKMTSLSLEKSQTCEENMKLVKANMNLGNKINLLEDVACFAYKNYSKIIIQHILRKFTRLYKKIHEKMNEDSTKINGKLCDLKSKNDINISENIDEIVWHENCCIFANQTSELTEEIRLKISKIKKMIKEFINDKLTSEIVCQEITEGRGFLLMINYLQKYSSNFLKKYKALSPITLNTRKDIYQIKRFFPESEPEPKFCY